MNPTKTPASVENTAHCQIGQPFVKPRPNTTAPKVIVELTERSIPAVATVKVCPTAIIAGIDAATKILLRLYVVKNDSGASKPKNAMTTIKAITTSQSDQKNGSLIFSLKFLIRCVPTASAFAEAVVPVTPFDMFPLL